MRNAARARKLGRLAAVAGMVFVPALGSGACGGANGGGSSDDGVGLASKRLGVRLEPVLSTTPTRAARFALAADRLAPTLQTELGMLQVAAGQTGIDRVIAAHNGPVNAIARLKGTVVTSGQDGALRIWDAATGSRLAERRLKAPIVRMASSASVGGVVLTADQDGAVALWDVDTAAAPTVRRLVSRHEARGAPLAVGFTIGGVTAFAAWPDGRVERWDVASGTRLSTLDLSRARGGLPWSRGAAPRLTAATVPGDEYLSKSALDVATTSGAVARIDLHALRGRTLVPAGRVADAITSLATTTYNDPTVVIGTDAGFLLWRQKDRQLTTGGGGRASVAFFDDKYVVASADGVRTLATGDADQGGTADPAGPPATLAAAGPGGAAIGRADGTVSLLGVPGSGLALSSGGSAPVARFGPQGLLLTVEGWDANHVSDLAAVRPVAGDPAGTEPLPKVRVYKPDRRWWPQGDGANDDWYVGDATIGDDVVAAAGQDPTGTAAVLVWNARTGRPLRRLPLTTGGVQPSTPSIATGVHLLPGRHLLAAYSAVQESIVLWSTNTWQRLATIAVGPAGGFAVTPDESRLIVAGLSDEQSDLHGGIRTSRLEFIDVGRKAIDHVVATKDTARVAVAPDGHAIATVDNSRLRILSPDGRHDLIRPVVLDAQLGTEVAWRPDGKVLAVGRTEGGVAIVDPGRGRIVAALPTPGNDIPMSLSWSPTGRVLAVTNAIANENGVGFKAVSPTFWRLDRTTLTARMCQLAARDMTSAEWRRDVGAGIAPQRPCAATVRSKAARGERAVLPRAPVVVFVRRGHVLAAGADGRAVTIAALPDGDGSSVTFAWSREGAVAWAAGGRATQLADGTLRSWPCGCSEVVFDGSALATVAGDGSELLTLAPGAAAARRIAVHGLPHEQPRLLARRGRSALVAGFTEDVASNDPPVTLAVVNGRRVRASRLVAGAISSAPVVDPDGRRVAFRVSPSGGACYPIDKVAVADIASGRVTYPALPADVNDPHSIRSITWPSDGALSALVSRPACSPTRELRWAPGGQLLRMDGDRFVRVPGRDYDIAVGEGLTARLTGRVPVAKATGRLVLTTEDGPTVRVADDVYAMSVRP